MEVVNTISQIESEKDKESKLLSSLINKNKVLIDFYNSFTNLENSLNIMDRSIHSIKREDLENQNQFILGVILKEAYSMNELFSKIVQKTSIV